MIARTVSRSRSTRFAGQPRFGDRVVALAARGVRGGHPAIERGALLAGGLTIGAAATATGERHGGEQRAEPERVPHPLPSPPLHAPDRIPAERRTQSDRSASLRRARFRPAPDVRSRRVIHPDARLALEPYEFAAARAAGGASWACPACSRRCSCGAGWGRRTPRARSWPPRTSIRSTRSAACGRRRRASSATSRRRSRITVHGDYDVDGICASAVLIRALRTLGADVDWYLPSRIDDGYGLAAATVDRLAARGTDLLVTVDCAITAVDEVARARAAGIDVVVTDHHSPRADGVLPDAPIVHPRVGGYPCPDLCAAARRAQARPGAAERGRRGPADGRRGPRPRRAGHGGRRRAAAGREPPARARGAARAGLHPQARPARADGRRPRGPEHARRRRDRLPARPAPERRRPAAPRRRRARAAADRGPRARARRGGGAGRGERRAARRRDAHPLRGRGPGGRAGRGRRLRARVRRLASRRDRDRRLADRRAPPPAGRADRPRRRGGHRARGARSRASTCWAACRRRPARWAATAGIARPPG